MIDLGRPSTSARSGSTRAAGCGDDASAALKSYVLAASDGPGKPYEQIGAGTVGTADARGYVTLPLSGDRAGRRLIRLTAVAPVSLSQDTTRPYWTSRRSRSAAPRSPVPPTPTPTATPQPPRRRRPPMSATPTTLLDTKLKADRKGTVKVSVRFGTGKFAPAGSARLRILGRRSKPIAEGLLTVRASRTSTKRIRLTKRGRKQIRRGKTKTVMLELRLPGGQKVKQTLKLTRARR